jgi:type IV secretory pathway TraG/TraD family ATPase VirD4
MAKKEISLWSRGTDPMNVVSLLAAFIFAVVLCARFIGNLRGRGRGDSHKRGVFVVHESAIKQIIGGGKKSRLGWLTVAGVAIPPCDETKHFKLIGSTGTGKSTAIRELLASAIARGDRAVFADPDRGYLRSFYHRYRGDVVLNPFEAESAQWNLFAEIENAFDIDQLASGLIPDCEDASAREWRGYARTFLVAVIDACRLAERGNVADLWRLLMVAPAEELRPLVAGTPAQPFLDPENARMFGSIRSVTGSALAPLAHIQKQRAAPFSVRKWVQRVDRPGLLFIPYRAGQIAALRSVIATWLYLAIFEAMNSCSQRDQRLWVVVDELDALGAISGLKDALARLRKFGGRCVLGFQSLAQVTGTYGNDAQTIVENCGNTLILRCSSSENGGTSQFASQLIGEREISRRQISRGRDREAAFCSRGSRRSHNVSEARVIETAVLPSELEQLPDLCGYLKTASSRFWRKVDFSRQ